MLPRLGAATGAGLCSLPRCCSDAELHQLVMWSKIVFRSSSDTDQARCALRERVGQNSYLFQVARSAVGSGWEEKSQKAAC